MARGVSSTTTDVTRLVERLAAQLARSHARHPVAAAVAIACRGNAGLDPAEFAERLGLPVSTVVACEAGAVPFDELPAALVADHDGLDLLALADLDDAYAHAPGGDRSW